jgi:hypothetical protein
MAEDVGMVDFDGVEYTQDEAKALINWMADPARALLGRYLQARRQSYIDMLDCGGITVENAEELVRGSAQCDLIRAIGEIAPALSEQVQDARIETS